MSSGISALYPLPENNDDLNSKLGLEYELHMSYIFKNYHTKFLHSIIAVHGLNGDSFRTWTEPKSKKMWLRDYLGDDLKRARIMTFGYDATAAFGKSMAGIEDHARALLGGLVEKRRSGEVSWYFCSVWKRG